MTEKIQTNVIEPKPIDDSTLINKSELKEKKISLIRPCLDSPKEKKGLFILKKEPQTESKEKISNTVIQPKRQIDLSPFQFHFPLKLTQNIENQAKEQNQKETKDNSDFEIDVMTESWGLNKLEKMEKELDGDTENEKIKIDLNNKKQEKEKESFMEEINIANEDNDEDISNSKNSIIDITELKGSDFEKDEQSNIKDKDYSFSDSVQKNTNKNRYLRGHCPFNFFEKEKCKNVDFKKVNVRSYISAISAQWKVMTDKEKEPYVKLSEDFKKKILSSNNLDDLEEIKMTNKKRKRKQKAMNKGNKSNNTNNFGNSKEEPKIINNNINFNNNKIENFSVYTTNRYVKNKTNKINNESNSNENKSIENESSSYIQQTLDKSENDKKESNNKILNDLTDKYKIIKNASKNKTNRFIKSVLIPFVVKSLEFLDELRSDNINEQS